MSLLWGLIYFLLTSIFGKKVIIKIAKLTTIHAYSVHCFVGHSPIEHADKTKKFLIVHAKFKIANAILNLFALMNGKANKIIFITPMYNINLPGCPKFVPATFQPVITQ